MEVFLFFLDLDEALRNNDMEQVKNIVKYLNNNEQSIKENDLQYFLNMFYKYFFNDIISEKRELLLYIINNFNSLINKKDFLILLIEFRELQLKSNEEVEKWYKEKGEYFLTIKDDTSSFELFKEFLILLRNKELFNLLNQFKSYAKNSVLIGSE